MKKALSLLLAMLLVVSLFAGCGQSSSPAPASNDPAPATQAPTGEKPASSSTTDFTGNLTVGDDKEKTADTKYADEMVIIQDNTKVALIDPHNAASATSSNTCVMRTIYDCLIEKVGEEYVPGLAESWEGDDAQHFVFHLRKGVVFHNGEPFTADDVAFTIERCKEIGSGSNSFSRLRCVESTEIVDDYTIKVNLEAVNVDFYKDLAYSGCGMLNREAVEKDPTNGPQVGTGAYKVVDFVPNETVVMEANMDYWGEKPITKKLTMKFVAEETARYIELQNGTADVVFSINPTNFPEIEANPKYQAFSYIVHNCGFLAFNMTKAPMNDLNFRLAVAYGIKRSDLITAARNGYAVEPKTGAFWGWNTEYLDESIPRIDYDLDKAKEYLAKSSYNGEELEIACAIADFIICAQVVQQQLAEVGIKIKLYQTDTTGMNAYANWGNNQAQMVIYTGGWNALASSCKPWYYPGNNYNRAAYDNPEVNALLDEAPTITDEAKREEIYKKVQQLTTADLPFYTLYNIRHVVAAQQGVGGLVLGSDSCHDFSHIYKVIE